MAENLYDDSNFEGDKGELNPLEESTSNKEIKGISQENSADLDNEIKQDALKNSEESIINKVHTGISNIASKVNEVTHQNLYTPRSDELPSMDEFLGSSDYSIPKAIGGIITGDFSNPDVNAIMDKTLPGRIAKQIGSGVNTAYKGTLGIEPGSDIDKALKATGVFNDLEKNRSSFNKSVNEAFIRPAAVAIDTGWRTAMAIFSGINEGVMQASHEAGGVAPELAEWAMTDISGLQGMMPHVPKPSDVSRAVEMGVYDGEAIYFGLESPTKEQQIARIEAAHETRMLEKFIAEKQSIDLNATPEPSKDIHAIAREIAPETFDKYDTLHDTRESLRAQLDEAITARDEGFEATPHNKEALDEVSGKIDTLMGKVRGVESRLTNKQTAQLEELRGKQESLLEESDQVHASDSVDMARIRSELQKVDYAMRDIAPEVSSVYRAAKERMPKEEVTAEEAPISEPIKSEEVSAPIPEEQVTRVDQKEGEILPHPPIEKQLSNIAQDVSNKLLLAGRSAEESRLAAVLWAEHYKSIVEQGWTKGTPEEVYKRDAANIIFGIGETKKGLRKVAQGKYDMAKGFLSRKNNTIHIMETADASTFIHETGHAWLEEMIKYGKVDNAPLSLKKDIETVNKWLGVKEDGKVARKQHEKFARGFERYLMEGTAPSEALAGVFAKFKQWLTNIYQTVKKLNSPITDDIRDVFDRLLSSKPEKVTIAPEHGTAKIIENLHERQAETTLPIKAAEVGDNIRATVDRLVKTHEPDIYNELQGTRPPEGIPDNASPIAGTAESGITSELGRGEANAAQQPSAVNASGIEASAKGRNVPSRGISKPEKKPLSLLEFISQRGGILDEGGDLKSMGAHEWHKGKVGKGKLIKETGKKADDIALAAQEAGYFPERNPEDRITINDLYEKIDKELRGEKQYPHDFIAMAAEDPAYVEHLAENMSIEESDALNSEIAAYHESLYAEYENLEKEWLESRGDSWEPTETKTATLEELENERRQENIAGTPQESPGNIEQSANASALKADSAEGVQHSGNPAEIARQEIKEVEKTPESPNSILGKAESNLVDKAGNIRLDNLNTSEDISEVIRQTAKDNDNFFAGRRGVVSDGQVLDLADALGMTAESLDKRKIGDAFNAEQIVAARKLLIQSATTLRDLGGKAATGGELEIAAYAEARSRHIMIQEQVAGITAEAGRALRAFRKLEGGDEAKALGEFLKEETGQDLFQLQKEAQLMMELDTPQKISKFINDTKKATYPEMVIEYWINSLLSGPMTHVKNMLGNSLTALNSVAETAIASQISKITKSDAIHIDEAKARLFGIMQGATEGITAASKIIKDENAASGSHTVEQYRQKAIPGTLGKVIRIPTRLLSAEDELFKAIAYRQELNSLAFREAKKEGLHGDALNQRMADIVMNPTEDLMKAAVKASEYQTFTNALGPTGRAIQNFANSHFLAKLIVPFIRTPTNILKYAGERTPLGLLSKEVRDNMAGVNGAAAKDIQYARLALGTTISTAIAWQTIQGNITGSGPTDKTEKAALRMTGWQPYSIKIGDIYYSYEWLDPFATIMGTTADIATAINKGLDNDADVNKILAGSVASISKNLFGKLSLRGVSDFMQMISDQDRYGDKYVQNFATSFVPSFIGQIARTTDPVMRESRTLLDAMKARIPGLKNTLLPKRDMWGEPIESEGSLGPDIFSPIKQTSVNNDPVNIRMYNLGYFPAQLKRQIMGVELTDQQYDEYASKAGQLAKMELDRYVQTTNKVDIPAGADILNMRGIIKEARIAAAGAILQSYPQILRTATANKQNILETGKKLKDLKVE